MVLSTHWPDYANKLIWTGLQAMSPDKLTLVCIDVGLTEAMILYGSQHYEIPLDTQKPCNLIILLTPLPSIHN